MDAHMKSTLRPFQAEGVRQINRFDGRAVVGDEVGLGKTIQALGYTWKYLSDEPGPTVVVCPSHLKLHWQAQAREHVGLHATVLSGQRVPRDFPPPDPGGFYVVNYDVLVPPFWKSRTPLPPDSWAAWLLTHTPRIVIVDEAHMVKEPRTARSRACKRLCRESPRALALTGTPLTNKPTDLWAPLNMIRPEEFPSQFEFSMRYTNATLRWYGWEFKGAKNLDELHRVLKRTCLIRRRKSDVLEQLPAVTHSVIPIEVDLTDYREAEADFVGWLEAKSPTKANRARRAAELTKLNALKKMAGELKVDAVVRWAKNWIDSGEGKLLLGGVHYSVTEPIVRAFGDRAVLVDGRMTDRAKNAAFDRFNRDPNCDVLMGNLRAAGTGWSCQASSDPTLIELPWTAAEVAQFIGRCHGINRGRAGSTTHARYMVAAGTVEELLCGVLQRKASWAAEAVDGGTPDEDAQLPLHDEVIRAMRERAANNPKPRRKS